MPLRPYQRDCLRNSLADYRAGIRRQLWILPTAAGKTVVASRVPDLIKQQPGQQGMFFVNRDDLVWQAAATLRAENPTRKVDIEKAEHRADPNADIIICSLQTVGCSDGISPRFARFDENRVIWAIVDECHGVIAKQPLNVLRHLRMKKGERDVDESKLLIGITATPDRTDGVGLEAVFDKISYEISIRELMETGAQVNGELYSYLAPVRGYRVTTDFDISMVRTRKGDFLEQDLSEALDNPERNRLVLDKYLQYGEGMPAIGFTVNVAHAHNLCAVFNAGGVPAMPISGDTSGEQRRKIYDAYRAGEVKLLASCAVLCLDDKTEVLTSSGWVGKNQMTFDHKIANWDNGGVYFKNPRNIIRRPRGTSEAMVSLESQDFSIRVTEDHGMLYRTLHKPGTIFKKTTAKNLVGRAVQLPCSGEMVLDPMTSGLDFKPKQRTHRPRATRIAGLSYSLRKRGFSHGEARAEAERRIDRTSSLKFKQPSELTIDECRLIGFWIGDGHRGSLIRGGVEYTMSQSERHPHIIQRVREIIKSCGIDSIERRHERADPADGMPYVTWHMPRGTGGGSQQRNGVYHLEPYLNKKGSPLLWMLSKEQFEAFLYGLWLADGDHGDGLTWRPGFNIHGTRVRKCLDLIQAIACCHGYYSNLTMEDKGIAGHSPVGRLYLRHREAIHIATKPLKIEQDWRDEEVWCVTSHSGNIVTRRNGKVIVMGNCEGFDMPNATVALMVTPYKSSLRYRQSVGRVLRRSPSVERMVEGGYDGWVKPCAVVIDFCDLMGKHSIQCVPSLFGLKPNFDLEGRNALEVAKEVQEVMKRYPGISPSSIRELRSEVDAVDIFRAPVVRADVSRASKFAWLEILEGVLQLNTRACTLEVRLNVLGRFDVYQTINGIRNFKESFSSLAEALRLADSMVAKWEHPFLVTKKKWRDEAPSEAQCRRVWMEDDRLRAKWKESRDFYNFAIQQHEAGNTEFSKGALSRCIDRWTLSKRAGGLG